ncbi:glycoside hydrolase family 16 protein [Haloprofundus halobius]|uniref:glycoside hydrolase family 16 protein n=1 Tax=Haloprofundus halobius TaxID=2876194 RepID=UPI001CCC70AF|nr:glycoside hydrolase family 16 protein [Haloprofundus halobius]
MSPRRTPSKRLSRRRLLQSGAIAATQFGAGCVTAGNGGLSATRNRTDQQEPPPTAPQNRPVDTSDMTLVFEDWFEGDSLDRSKWMTKFPWDTRTHNFDAYAADENAYVEDGKLVLLAEDKPREEMSYTTGVVAADWIFGPGYFEGVMKVPPRFPGSWPAFWLTSASVWPPEVDIFEFFGDDPKAYMSYHYNGEDNEIERVYDSYDGGDYSDGFHEFSVDWDPPERIVWYIDGEERFRYTGDYIKFEHMHLILNFGLGADFLGYPSSEYLPSTYEIERIRAWER